MRARYESRPFALLDTSAYFALASSRESRHPGAAAIAARLQAERWRLFTTNYIVAETHALLLIRVNRSVAAQFLAQLDASPTAVIRATRADEQRGRAIIAQYRDKDFSLTDAISFAVMDRLRIPYAFYFDYNFAQYGAALLRPDAR